MNATDNENPPAEPQHLPNDSATEEEETVDLPLVNPLLPKWLLRPYGGKKRAGITTNKGLKRSRARAKMATVSRRRNRRG